MERIIIAPKTEQEYSFVMEMLRRLKIKATPVADTKATPPCRMTIEELNRDVDEALEDIRAGRVTSHEDFKKEMARW